MIDELLYLPPGHFKVRFVLEDQEDQWEVPNGAVLEVVGFVHHSYQTWAIYVTDEGYLREIRTGL